MNNNSKLTKEQKWAIAILLITSILGVWLRPKLSEKAPRPDLTNTEIQDKKSKIDIDSIISANRKEKEKDNLNFKKLIKDLKKEYRVKYDDIENIYWIYDKSSPVYDNQNGVFVYVGLNENMVWRRFRIQYFAEDWLFIRSYIFKVDNNVLDWTPTNEPKRDNDGGYIWEVTDESPTSDAILGGILTQVALANNVKIRYVGDYTKDKVLSKSQIKAILRMNNLYFKIDDMLSK